MGLIVPILLLGLLSSLSPITLVVFILLLETTRGRVNALAFLVGWAISLTLVFYLSYAFGLTHTMREGSGSTSIEVVKICIGIALVVTGARHWARRNGPQISKGVSPAIAGRMRDLTPRGAVALGILKQPWSITASAALVVLSHHTAPIVTVLAFGIFTVVSTATVAAIFYYYTTRPAAAGIRLQALSADLTQRTPALIAVVSATVGFVLIIDGALALLTT